MAGDPRRAVKRWAAAKRQAEDTGSPFLMSDPPPLEPPEWFLAEARVPDEPIQMPEQGEDGTVTAAPGVDLLGRPTNRLLTAEEKLQAMAKPSATDRIRNAVRKQS